MGTGDHKVTSVTDRKSPNFTVVSLKLLYIFELQLYQCISLSIPSLSLNTTNLVTIPIFQHLVFAHSPEVVGLVLKCNLHDTLIVRKYRLVAVAEVKTPDFDILIRRAGDDKFGVGRYVHRQDGELRMNSAAWINSHEQKQSVQTHLVTIQ